MNNSQSRFSLLLVDDESTVLLTLKKTFSKNNYDIHTALSAREGLELINRQRVDAALIDFNMPEMDGLARAKNW